MNLGKQTALVRLKSSDVGGESVTTSFTPGLRRKLSVSCFGSWKDCPGSQQRRWSFVCLEVTTGAMEVEEFGQRRI